MWLYFKDVRVKRGILIILGGLVFVVFVLFGPSFAGRSVFSVLGVLAWIFVVEYFMGKELGKRLDAMTNLLIEDCNPEAFIKAYQGLLRGRARSDAYVYVQLSSGYYHSGQPEECLQMVGLVAYTPAGDNGKMYRAVGYANRMAALMEMGRLEEAKLEIGKLEAVLDETRRPAFRQKIEETVQSRKMALAVVEGRLEGTEEFYAEAMKRAGNRRDVVGAQYSLGKVLCLKGRPDEAKPFLEYVVANGNKLHIVAKAQKALAQMAQQAP